MSVEERVRRAVAGIKARREKAQQTTGYRVVACGESTWFPSLRTAYAAARKGDVRTPNTGIHVVEAATGKVAWCAAPGSPTPSSEGTGAGGPTAE